MKGSIAKPIIGILMGSLSDMDVMKECVKVLKKIGVPYEIEICSAHRSPEKTTSYSKSARSRGLKVIIVGAGAAAHLGGIVAAHTTLPVVAVPIDSSPLNGIDSLFATVQMPSGIPVACMAIGKSGAKNAAYYAVEILATSDKEMERRLEKHKKDMVESVEEQSARALEMIE